MKPVRHNRQAPQTWTHTSSSSKEARQATTSPWQDNSRADAPAGRRIAQNDEWVELANETLKLIRQLRI